MCYGKKVKMPEKLCAAASIRTALATQRQVAMLNNASNALPLLLEHVARCITTGADAVVPMSLRGALAMKT